MNQYNKDGSKPYCYIEVWNTKPEFRTSYSDPDFDVKQSSAPSFSHLITYTQFTSETKSKQTIAIWRITLKK